MDRLEEFRAMVDSIDDKLLLEDGLGMLRDMIRINAIKEELKSLEEGLMAGQRAIFYFFTDELDEDQVVFAAERISGRIKRLERSESPKKSE
jgi:hypothetical protein